MNNLAIYLMIFSVWISSFCLAITEGKLEVAMANTGINDLNDYLINISYLEANPEKEKVILFIHGNSASKEFFEKLMREPLLANYRLIAVDLPGHGNSDGFPQKIDAAVKKDENKLFDVFRNYYTFPGYANVLNNFLQKLGLDPNKVSVFGWSVGGHVAIDMLHDNPKLEKIILSGTPVYDLEAMAKGPLALKEMQAQSPFPTNITVFDILSYNQHFNQEQAEVFHQFGGIPPSDITRKAGIVANPATRNYMVKFAVNAPEHQEKLRLANYQDQEKTVKENPQKFIVLQGEDDPIKIKDEARQNLESLGVKILEIPNVGHAPFYNTPSQVAKLISQVIN